MNSYAFSFAFCATVKRTIVVFSLLCVSPQDGLIARSSGVYNHVKLIFKDNSNSYQPSAFLFDIKARQKIV